MSEATYPLEDRGICCMDCERRIEKGQPYSKRLVSIMDDFAIVELVCVYCVAPVLEERSEG